MITCPNMELTVQACSAFSVTWVPQSLFLSSFASGQFFAHAQTCHEVETGFRSTVFIVKISTVCTPSCQLCYSLQLQSLTITAMGGSEKLNWLFSLSSVRYLSLLSDIIKRLCDLKPLVMLV